MLTPQELREKTFEKAMFGGYDMGGVDNFLDAIASDYAALYAENTTLRGKMKVLVDKIEEYRATEDGMRRTILAAQRMSEEQVTQARDKSVSMLQEAESRSTAMLRDAEDKVSAMLREAQTEVAVEEAKLLEAKRSCAQYVERMRLLCSKQLDFFDKLGEGMLPELREAESRPQETAAPEARIQKAPAPEPQRAPGWDSVRSIEDSVSKLSEASEAPEVKPGQRSVADSTDEPTRLFDLDSLRFGDK